MIYQLKITLLNIQPPIWRRVLVDGRRSLDDLHVYMQIAMGWTNSHDHEFRIGDFRYGMYDPEFDDLGKDVREEELFTLEEVAPFVGVEFLYLYDFGDDWQHQVKVEAIEEPEEEEFKPVCLAGERSCPPEDVGGVSGYAEFLKALSDSDHPEHTSTVDWIGGKFDPEYYPIDNVNKYLAEFDIDAFYDSIVDTSYTYRQGQYLAFIHYYTKVNGIPPAQADIQRYFGVTAPSVNSMLKRLEEQGFISRIARRPRSIRVLIDQSNLPELD